ncbi:glycosyltransferase family 2 protein [Gracilibacillus marinus]|uniref:Glycosyltransferase family 2 protein n=1 Tax=Gracilibacillus marinus TaxID=630535 RepID=A0ABV8VRK5_9BACI
MNPKLSIIIPTYNRPVALSELLASLAAQTYQDFEVIIINDAGSDISKIVDAYEELHCQIINLEQNSYHVRARNRGLELASGEWIMLIDDDDLILPTHIETMFQHTDDYDLLYSDVEIVNYMETEMERIPLSSQLFAYTYDLDAMKKFSTYVPSGSMYKKSIHVEIGKFDEEMRNYWDWDFFLRVAEKYRVKRVPVASVLYEFSVTGNNQSKNLDKMRKYLDRLSEKHHLGTLPTKNFFILLEEPEVKEREAVTKKIWDGKMIPSRYMKQFGTV